MESKTFRLDVINQKQFLNAFALKLTNNGEVAGQAGVNRPA